MFIKLLVTAFMYLSLPIRNGRPEPLRSNRTCN